MSLPRVLSQQRGGGGATDKLVTPNFGYWFQATDLTDTQITIEVGNGALDLNYVVPRNISYTPVGGLVYYYGDLVHDLNAAAFGSYHAIWVGERSIGGFPPEYTPVEYHLYAQLSQLRLGYVDPGLAGTFAIGDSSNNVNVSITGSLSMNSFKITSLATPTVATDGATKGYVDGKTWDRLTSSASTLILSDDGTDQTLTGNKGHLKLSLPSGKHFVVASNNVLFGTGTPSNAYILRLTGDTVNGQTQALSFDFTNSNYDNACYAATMTVTLKDVTGGSTYGALIKSQWTGTGNNSFGVVGGWFLAQTSPPGTGTIQIAWGGRFDFYKYTNCAIVQAVSGMFTFDTQDHTGTITEGAAVYINDINMASYSPTGIAKYSGVRVGLSNYGTTDGQAIRIVDQTNYVGSQSATSGNLIFEGGDYKTGHLQFTTFHIWRDATNSVLKFKETAPAATTDGFSPFVLATAVGGGATATLGLKGNANTPATTGQAGWLKMFSGNTVVYVPYWT